MADSEGEWEVKCILKRRTTRKKGVEYQVDWEPVDGQTWPPSWEPAANIHTEMVAEFEADRKKAAAEKKRAYNAKRKAKRPPKMTKKKKKTRQNSKKKEKEKENEEENAESSSESDSSVTSKESVEDKKKKSQVGEKQKKKAPVVEEEKKKKKAEKKVSLKKPKKKQRKSETDDDESSIVEVSSNKKDKNDSDYESGDYVVEKLVDCTPPNEGSALRRNLRPEDYFYLAKWQGYPESDNTWMSYESLNGCDDLVKELFERKGLLYLQKKKNFTNGVVGTGEPVFVPADASSLPTKLTCMTSSLNGAPCPNIQSQDYAVSCISELYDKQIGDELETLMHKMSKGGAAADEKMKDLMDLLIKGMFHTSGALPERYLKKLRKCAGDIKFMICERYATSHRTQSKKNKIDLFQSDSLQLAEVWRRGSTIDFALHWWRAAYPELDRVATHAPWYLHVIKPLGRLLGTHFQCQWIGMFHTPPDSDGQTVHVDGAGPDGDGALRPRLPLSLTVVVPLTDLLAVDNDGDCDDLLHSGATEFYLGTHLRGFPFAARKKNKPNKSSYSTPQIPSDGGSQISNDVEMKEPEDEESHLSKNSDPPASSQADLNHAAGTDTGAQDPSSAKPQTPPSVVNHAGPQASSSSSQSMTANSQTNGISSIFDSPFQKGAILARAGDALGWGFDLYHCGGPNSSDQPCEKVYFVYHARTNETQDDMNIESFTDAKRSGASLFTDGKYCIRDAFTRK
eukprot:253717_1